MRVPSPIVKAGRQARGLAKIIASAAIPEGSGLPEGVWRQRHAGFLTLLWLHAIGIACLSLYTGQGLAHSLFEGGIIAGAALVAALPIGSRTVRAAIAAFGLVASSAVLVHLSGGYIELHFHFFVMVGLMALYEEWVPFLVAIAFVMLHHGVVGVLEPSHVYNHAAAIARPLRWAMIHAVFIAAMSAVSLLTWRLNEIARAQAERRLSENTRLYEELRNTYEELSRTQAQLTQAQKMEAIGRLAGGVAHDFNNLLTIIAGRSLLLRKGVGTEAKLARHVELIEKTTQRAASLTGQLLAFSRKQMLQPKVLDLNGLVGGLSPILGRLIGEDIDLLTRLHGDLASVEADPSQLEQVLLNLAVNARDAMPRGGRLTIETANVVLDSAYAARHAEVQAGPHVLLAVSDSGTGMDADTKARIFEPFFTTKGPGRGTGLGLATVYGIVKQSGGHIAVYSELGHGTTFKVYLPAVDRPVEPAEGQAPLRPPTGAETLLVVEDEEELRDLLAEALEGIGYTVLRAQDCTDAMKICGQHAGPIHLLLTDVVMPQMSGRALAARVQPRRPTMKVLYMSGYTDSAIVHHGVLEPGIAFLQKPFTPETVAHKVREVLDGSPELQAVPSVN